MKKINATNTQRFGLESPFEILRSPFERYTVLKQRSAHGNMADRYQLPYSSTHNTFKDASCRPCAPINCLAMFCNSRLEGFDLPVDGVKSGS